MAVALLGGATSAVAQVPQAPDPAPGTVPATAATMVTAQVDPQHTSHAVDPELFPPLEARWQLKTDGAVVAAVAGDGAAFVRTANTLAAYDAATGSLRWTVPIKAAGLAYDAGRVFVTVDTYVVALSALDGHELWRRQVFGLNQTPVATAGRVYYGTSNGVVALDAADGKDIWRGFGSGHGAVVPAVDAAAVYGGNGCGIALAWSRLDGSRLWKTADCTGGGDVTPTIYEGRIYFPGLGRVYDAGTGAAVGTTLRGRGVFAEGIAVFIEEQGQRTIAATRLATGKRAWTRTLARARIRSWRSYPVAVGHVLYLLHDGDLLAYEIASGRLLERARVTLDAEQSSTVTLVPAGEGRMLIAGGRTLLLVQSALRPEPGAVAARPMLTDVVIGERVRIEGRVGAALAPSRPVVQVEVDPAPFGGGYRRAGRVTPGADGRFSRTLALERNSRVRVRVASLVAQAGTVYVYPRYRFSVGSAGRDRFRVRYTVRGPRALNLSRRRVVVYYGRPASQSYIRLGSGRLTRIRAGLFGGSITAPRRTKVGANDFITSCIPGGGRLGLGRPDLLQRRCGRRTVAFQ